MGKNNINLLPYAAIQTGTHIELYSNKEAIVEEIKGIVEYSDSYIKLSTGKGIVEFFGTKLEITALSVGGVVIGGEITRLEFGV